MNPLDFFKQPLHSTNSQNASSPPSSQEPLYHWPPHLQAKSIFGSNQKHIVLFAYSKQKNENSPQEIMVLQQPKKKHKTDNPMQAQNQHNPRESSGVGQQKLFLKKVDPQEKVQIAEQIKQMLSFSNQLTLQERLERRKQIFQSSNVRKKHQMASEEVLAKRTIKVVKMDSLMEGGSIRGVVQLGSKTFQYETLNLNESQQEYYRLVKKVVRADEMYPFVQGFNDELLDNISYEPDERIREYPDNDDQYDSEDSDNPKFDYPDEEGSERSSEGIIPRQYDSDEGMVEDEEEIYTKYLRRENKREKMQSQYDMDIQDEDEDFW